MLLPLPPRLCLSLSLLVLGAHRKIWQILKNGLAVERFAMGNSIAYEKLLDALEALRKEKPEERPEEARRCAVAITELEKVVAYYWTFIENKGAA